MEVIEIKTLVDITKPNHVHRPSQGEELEQNQYKNWITFQQCIGLRSNIEYDALPQLEKSDVKGLGFGSSYKGNHHIWTFEFRPDRSGAYVDDEGNSIGLLIQDLHQVPIIKNLLETINILKAVFDIEDPQYKNIIVRAVKHG